MCPSHGIFAVHPDVCPTEDTQLKDRYNSSSVQKQPYLTPSQQFIILLVIIDLQQLSVDVYQQYQRLSVVHR